MLDAEYRAVTVRVACWKVQKCWRTRNMIDYVLRVAAKSAAAWQTKLPVRPVSLFSTLKTERKNALR